MALTKAKLIDLFEAGDFVDLIYPIGSIYMSAVSADPGTLFGGTWSAWGAGRVPVGIDANQTEFDTVEETGGANTVTLTADNIPVLRLYLWATESGGSSVGGYVPYGSNRSGAEYTTLNASVDAHNNLQPYIVCYMWKRTA